MKRVTFSTCGIYEGQKGEAADTNWNLITNKLNVVKFLYSVSIGKKLYF